MSQFVNADDLPWQKVEDHSEKIQDDDQSFPTSKSSDPTLIARGLTSQRKVDVWTVSFTDPKAIKPLQECVIVHLVSLMQRTRHSTQISTRSSHPVASVTTSQANQEEYIFF
jgi:hypothetical protein